MIWTPYKVISKKFLGIDIGTSSIKVIELSRFGARIKLENYGEIRPVALYEKPYRIWEKTALVLSEADIIKAILAILKEAKIKTKRVAFSIPDFSSFFTWFSLPKMTKEEVPSAVKYEARQHIPLPLSEVTLDWQIIEGRASETPLKILLVAVPNEVINQCQRIAAGCGLSLMALEAEVFALCRSSIKNEKKVIALVDIGAQSTTISIIDKGILKRSHSFDISGNDFTQAISKSRGIDYQEAEGLKLKYGILSPEEHGILPAEDLRKILLPWIDLILIEIKKIAQSFYQLEIKEIEKVVIAGSSALLPGLKEYFMKDLRKEVQIADPFSDIFYPPILEATLKQMGPAYAIAVGVALRGLE